jgi:uncharacterized membrane protein YccF (DUF307 family)
MTTVSDLDNRGQRAAGAPFWLRVVWFALVGWWLGGLVISLAYLCLATIIGFPIAFWLFDRVPFALTLKPRSAWSADPVGSSVVRRLMMLNVLPTVVTLQRN